MLSKERRGDNQSGNGAKARMIEAQAEALGVQNKPKMLEQEKGE